jgi:hypothetical protein
LIYLFWSDDSLAEFKRRCEFERIAFALCPATWRGALALKLGAQRGWKALIPVSLRTG